MRVLRRCIAPILVSACLGSPGFAAAATYHVAPSGSDSADGTEAAPLATISRAARMVKEGDTVLVSPGVYPETVRVTSTASGVTFRGVGATRPVIAGEGIREFGFQNDGARDLTIENFEVTGQFNAGIYSAGQRARITGNLVHHVGKSGVNHSTGIRIVHGTATEVRDNAVHSVGPGGESMGIWLLETRDAVVAGNSVYFVRKEGIRDWKGLDNTISSNRVFLSGTGIVINTTAGGSVLNNYLHDNTGGLGVKHLSDPAVLSYWGLAEGRWTRVWQNTVWNSTGAALSVGSSDEPLDYLDVRNNLFQNAGYAYIHDIPELRGPHVIVDGNGYAPPAEGRATFLYKAGWQQQPAGATTLAAYREQVGWDEHGRVLDPAFADPTAANFDYGQSSAASAGSLDLGPPYGTQLGARGLPPGSATWTAYPMRAVDSSSPGTWWTTKHLQDTADDNQFSYWLSLSNHDEFVVYDFGQRRTFDRLVLTVFRHFDKRNIRGYRFEVSDDREHWTTVLEGENPDSGGSAYKYELPQAATGRYLRFTMRSTFCDSYAPDTGCGEYFVFSDLRAGTMGAGTETEPPAVRVKVPPQTLSRVLRTRAVKAQIRCDQRCSISSDLFHRQRVKLGRGDAQLRPGRKKLVRIRLRPPAVRKLADAKRIKLNLETTASNPSTGESSVKKKVRLHR